MSLGAVACRMDVDSVRHRDGFTHEPYGITVDHVNVDGMQKCQDALSYPNAASTTTMVSLPSQDFEDSPRGPFRLYANSIVGLDSSSGSEGRLRLRRKREFIPEDQKDGNYWSKRKRNNEAAKRSRQRRRVEDILLEGRAVELLRENEKLKATLSAVQHRAVGVDSRHERYLDSYSGQNFSEARYFHPSSSDVSHAASLMLPSAPSSLGANFRMAKGVSGSRFTDCSGFIHTPGFPSGDTCRINHVNQVSPQFPYSDYFSGAAVPDSYSPMPNDYQCYRNACSVEHYLSHAFDVLPRYSTPQNIAISEYAYPVKRKSAQLNANALGQFAQDAAVEGGTAGGKPLEIGRARHGTSPGGQKEGIMEDERNGRPDGRIATETSIIRTMLPLPHKLRHKVNKVLKEQSLITRASTTSDIGIKTSAQLRINSGSGSPGDAQELAQGNCAKESHSCVVESDKDKVTIMTTSPKTVSGEMSENGHLRDQLASLCAEVKNLKQMILAKSK